MPRWKALPEELDPQVSEFTSQLRRLVDRSGMGLATIADRTGYSKSSWEKYLNGRLLPPRGAVQALSEVTGTEIRHLATMWELAERAWSRSEMRHDMTMEAVLVAQARAALAPSGETPAKGWKWNRAGKSSKERTDEAAAGVENASAKDGVTEPPKPTPQRSDPARPGPSGSSGPGADNRTVSLHWRDDRAADDSKTTQLSRNAVFGEADARRGRNFSADPGGKSAGTTAPSPPTAPSGPAPQDPQGKPAAPAEAKASVPSVASDIRPKEGQGSGLPVSSLPPGAVAGTVDPRSWSARDGFARPGAGSGEAGTAVLGTAAGAEAPQAGIGQGPVQAGPAPAVGAPGPPSPAERPGGDGRRRGLMVLVGVLAALVVVAAGAFAWDFQGSDPASAKPTPSTDPELPNGVKCSGQECYDKDPEAMGCGGQHAKTAGTGWVGPSMVEVRYSEVCGAAWARISGAAEGDSLRIEGTERSSTEQVGTSNYAYTSMVPVDRVGQARACATLDVGNEGCVRVGDSTAPPE